MHIFLEYIPTVRDIHLLAVVYCLALALLADLRAARLIKGPLKKWDLDLLEHYHVMLSVGLAALWGSGFALVGEVTNFDVANLSPKLIAKIAVVMVLTVNARFIGSLAFGAMSNNPTATLGEIASGPRMTMCVMSFVSLASWISATALGAMPMFKPMPAEQLFLIFGGAYAFAILSALLMSSVIGIATPIIRRGLQRGSAATAQMLRPL